MNEFSPKNERLPMLFSYARPIRFFLPICFFLALLCYSCKNGGIVPPEDNKPDTTSHSFIWDVQTIGVFQSSLSDVWGSSPTDVWAVGRITDTTSNFFPNAAHFDGNKWSLVQIGEGFNIFGIHGFSSNNIFAVGTNGRVYRWSGTQWLQSQCLGTGDGCIGLLSGEPLLAVWGTSSNDLFAVGDSGVIVRYNGQTWTNMESSTNLTLFDLWGSSSNDIYAVGMDFFSAQWVVLHYDGNDWQSVFIDSAQLNRPEGVWGISTSDVYIASDFVFHYDGSAWKKLQVPNTLYTMHGVEGTGTNDLFVVGSFGLVLHWNGAAWKQYEELLMPQGGRLLRRVWANGNDVFVVGSTQSQGLVIHGRRL